MTYPTLCYNKIGISKKMKVLPPELCPILWTSKILPCMARRLLQGVVNLAGQRWTLRCDVLDRCQSTKLTVLATVHG